MTTNTPIIKTEEPKLFPNNVIQFILTIFLSSIICTPLILLEDFLHPQFWNLTYYISTFCVFIIIVIFKNKERKIKLSFNFKVNNTIFLGFIILGVIIYQIGVAFPFYAYISYFRNIQPIATNPFISIDYIFFAILLAPIAEEILFRGILFKGLLCSYTPKTSLIISSIFFALIHINPMQIFFASILGFILGYIYYKTKSLGNVILIHLFANTAGVMGQYINYKSKFFTEITLCWYGIIYILTSIIILVLLWKYIKNQIIQTKST